MKLSRKKAIELCIELWTWLAETGRKKWEWPGWEKYGRDICCDCWFCEYDAQQMRKRDMQTNRCPYCPLVRKFGIRCTLKDSFYEKWDNAKTPRTRKKYAKLFLKQIKTLS